MNPIYIWSALAVTFVVLTASTIILGYKCMVYRNRHKAHLDQRKKGVLDDLELATSDQLLNELRRRSGCPYLMLSPIEGEDHKGISIEIHNIPPVPCLQMLHIATAMTFKQLKAQGVDLPEMPFPFGGGEDQEGEEWKNKG